MAGDCGRAEDSASSGGSGANWEGQDEDFYSQMDENGIVDLRSAADEACLEVGGAEKAESDAVFYQDRLQDQSFHLSDLRDSPSPGGDSRALTLYSQASEEDESSWLIHRLPERDRQLDMTEDEEKEEEDTNDPEEFSDSSFFRGTVGPRDRRYWTEALKPVQVEERNVSLEGCCHGNHDEEEMAAAVQVSRDSPVESHEGGPLQSSYPPVSTAPPAIGPRHFLGSFSSTPVHPCLTDRPGLESDAVIESQSVLEAQVEARLCQKNHGLRGGISPNFEGEESQDRRDFTPVSCFLQSRRVLAQGTSPVEAEDQEADGRPEGPDCSLPASSLPRSPKLMRGIPQVPSPSASQCTPKVWQSPSDHAPCLRGSKSLRTSAGESPKRGCSQDYGRYGKGRLNHPLPDFSKVEPRVHFPKGDYKPPKSRGFPQKKGPACKKPLVFKSPADIVREVLSSTDAPLLSAPPPTLTGSWRPLNATLPPEFRSPLQASTLAHQLQEDYNRLLTKYAEAENTIDRLRLEAKVNLYSELPEPSHPDYTGTLDTGSKVVTMTLYRAQRAELDRIALSKAEPEETVEMDVSPSVSSTLAHTSACSLGPRYGERLTEALPRQAGRFQMQVDAFEELLRGGKLKPFEVLKGLSCLAQGQGSLERGYRSAREEHRLQQQQGRDPGPFDPNRELEGEIFCSGMRLEELKERVQTGEQVQPVTTAPPLTPPGTDLTMDPSAVFAPCPNSESQQSLDWGLAAVSMGVAVISAGAEKEGEGETNERQPSPLSWAQRLADQSGETGMIGHLLRQVLEGTGESAPSPSSGHSQQEPLPLRPMFPRQQSLDQSWGGAKSRSSSSASAAESVAFEDRASKPPSGLRRAPPQDGLMSPETDSGFVGSESSHLNLAAPSPARQEAMESQSFPLERGGDKMLSICTRPRLGPACQGLASAVCSGAVANNSEVPPSGEKSRLAPPRSLRRWPSSSSAEFESESDRPHSLSEGEEESQSVRYNRPANRRPHHQRRPSLTGLHRHGDPSGIQGSGQPADRHTAIQSLQDEVSRLGEQLEGSLCRSRPSYTITAPPLIQEDQLHSQNSCGLYPRFSQYQKDERSEEEGEQEEEGELEEEEEEVEQEEEVPCKKSSPVPDVRPELDITPDSQLSQNTSKPQCNGTRITQSTGERRRWKGEERGKPVAHGRPHTGNQYGMAASRGPDKFNQRQGRNHAHSNHGPDDIDRNPTRAGTAGGVANTRHSCPRSGYRHLHLGANRYRDRTDSGLSKHRTSGSAYQNVWPMGFTHRKDGGVFLVAPPPPVLGSVPLVQYVPISPSVLYYSAPASEAPLTHLVLDGGGRGARRHTRALSADQGSLGDSLTRAIEAARHMRTASRRMARSLSASVRHQGALSLS